MSLQVKAGFTGLLTNIAETQSPPGALLEAENVVIRKPGAVEARDGVTLGETVAGGFAAWGFSWRSKDFYVRNNGSNVFNWRDTAGGTYQYTDLLLGAINPQPLRRDVFSRAEARANLYLPYDSGVLKMETDAGPWKMAGLPLLSALSLSSTTAAGAVWLGNNEQVAYRIVSYSKDANGVERRSIPGGALLVSNTSGSTVAVNLSILTGSGTVTIELYRTRNFATTVTPDDEMQLVATLVGISGSYAYTDRVAPTARGGTLYTSPSRGGIALQNERPPAAAAVALFKGSVFFANVRGPQRIKVSRNWAGTIATATGVGIRQPTGDVTNLSPTILNVSSTVGLEKGQTIVGMGHIISIVGTTVTMSANSSFTAVGTTLSFQDSIKVGGQWMTANLMDQSVAILVGTAIQAYRVTPPEGGYNGTFVLESISRAVGSYTIQATHGSEYNPPLPNFDGTPMTLAQDVWPGGIYWSKTDEPEHVPPANFAFVGEQRKAILGLVPTRDALFILKEDGLFRLTGVNGEWRIDPYDPYTFCALPSSVRGLHERAYFLSQKGVVALSDEGVELVSGPISDMVKPIIDKVITQFATTGFYELDAVPGASTACVFERENEYTIMRSSTLAPLVFNGNTKAWTTWAYHSHATQAYTYKALFGFERTGKCVYTLGNDYYTTVLSTQVSANYERYDRATSITVSSYAAGVATLSAPITALADDVIEDANENSWRITADVVASASVPVVLGGGSAAMATGAGYLYRPLRCQVVAAGYTEPGAAQKRWGTFMTAWAKLVGAVRVRYAYQSSEDPAWVEEDAVSTVSTGTLGPGYTNYTLGYAPSSKIPNASARAWLLRVRVRWVQAFGQAQLEGMVAENLPMSAGSPQAVAP